MDRAIRRCLAIAAGAAAYYAAGRVGFAFAFEHGTVSAVWPPTGVALALVVLGGPRMLPAVFLGELAADLGNGSGVALSVAFACGSTCEALTGYWLLKRARFRPDLRRVRDVFALLGPAALISTLVSATIATTALLVDGSIARSDIWSTWHVWWLGDVTGDLIVAPLLFVVATTRRRRLPRWRLLEALAFTAALVGIAVVAKSMALGVAYLVLPVMIWAALRFRQQGAVLANVVIAAVSATVAASAASQLARVSVAERVLFTQNFVTIGAIATLVLAAVLVERDRATAALEASRAEALALLTERTAMAEIATAIAHDQPPTEIFDGIARRAAALVGAAGSVIVQIEDHGAATAAGTWSREEYPFFRTGAPFPLTPGSAAGHVALSRAGCRVSPDPAVAHCSSERVAVPISLGDRLWGTISVTSEPGARLPDTAEALLERLADLAATAIGRAEARDRLLTEATTDALTGLANHRVFERRLAEETARAERYDRPLAVALIDVDDFKSINDTAGHLAGDAALAEVAGRIRAVTRGDALLARIGGDEFGLLLPECDDAEAYLVAERARRAVLNSPIGEHVPLTVSVGVAETAAGAAPNMLRRCADVALYAAKLEGGNRAVRYTPALTDEQHDQVRARKLAGLRSLAQAIDARDPDTAEHSKRVAELATALAHERGWEPDRIELLREAALVHDVGKIGVPDSILLARRQLGPDEYEQVKQHAALGAQLAADVLSREQALWIRWHHERADGTGYPDGLTADDLPEGAKLLAVADAWDAMTTSRRYRRARPITAALAECRRLSGAQFAPEAIDALAAVAGSQRLVRT